MARGMEMRLVRFNQFSERKRRPMKSQMKVVAAAVLAASLVGTNAYAGDPPAPAKKHAAAKKPPKPTVEDQINALRQEMQTQIDGLKSDLATKDTQLKQAQQTAA